MRRIAVVLCLLLAVSGCARADGPRENARLSEGTLVIAQAYEPRTLNPLFAVGGSDAAMLGSLMFSYLLTVDEHENLVPDAAVRVPTIENGDISRDKLRITYHLRHGIRWQDGAPLTSRDCTFTFQAVMNPRNSVVARYDEVRSVEAPDAYTVVVRLKRPSAPITAGFLALDGNFPILPAHLLRRYAELKQVSFGAHPISSGPFHVVEWRRGDHLTMEANPTYFRGRPGLARIIVKFVANNQTIINQLRTGEVDAVPFAFAELYRELTSIPGKRVVKSPVSAILSIVLNTASGPTADINVRRAIARSIDVPAIVRNAMHGGYIEKDAMRGLFGWAYRPIGEPPPYDPRAAALLLDASGWRLGADGVRAKNGQRLVLSFAITSVLPSSASVATMVQQQLRQIGAEVTIRSYASSLYAAPASEGGALLGGKFSLAMFGPQGGVDPDTTAYYSCAQRAPAGFNVSRICDPRIETFLKDGVQSYDRARRVRDTVAIERLLREEVPEIVLGQVLRLSVIPKNMLGFAPASMTEYVGVWRWKIQPGAR